jgi:cytochrome P450
MVTTAPPPIGAGPMPRARRVIDQLRSTAELATDPHRGLPNLYRRFGPVCTLGVGPTRNVFLLGAEANRFVLGHSELFRWREAFDALVVVDGETALIVSDGADHQRRRRLVQPAFSRRRIDGYAQTMRTTADAAIDTWRPGQRVDLYQEFRRVIRRATIQVLFGQRLADDEPELGRLLQHALAVVERPPPWQQLQRFGTPAWRRATSARATVAGRVLAEVEHRRRAVGCGTGSAAADASRPDVLGLLVGSRDDDGSGLTDQEIADQVISLIAAGYETTSAAMAWAARALLTDRSVWRRARASLDRAVGWRYLDGVVSETLRLHPPAVISVRSVAEPFSFAGVEVAAGSRLVYSPYVTHRLPELWPDPLRFDPTRWDPDRAGHRTPGPHEFLPFGGGPHRCLGAAFATTELTVLLERLLQRVSSRLEPSDARPVGLAAMRPRSGPFARILAVN